MLKLFSHISLTILLLMSMSDFNRVVLLGYTVLTDSQKAAHFCTCSGCNHQSDQETTNHKSENEPEICLILNGSTKHQMSTKKSDDKSCCSSSNKLNDVSICQCSHNTSPVNSIAVFNTIDKTALFSTTKWTENQLKGISQFFYIVHKTIPFFREIFHPPR